MDSSAAALLMAGPRSRKIQVHHRALEGELCVVALGGEIDLASAPALRSALVKFRQAGYSRFVLELSEVSHMDSTGLGALLGFSRSLDREGQIALAAVPQRVATLLEMTGLERRFAKFASVDAAVAGISRLGHGP